MNKPFTLDTWFRDKIGVYAITCLIDGRRYVGGTTNLYARGKDHLQVLRQGRHSNPILQRHFDRYGVSHSRFDVLAVLEPDQIHLVEEYLILEELDAGTSYNLYLRSVDFSKRPPPTAEQKKKISDSLRAKPPRTDEHNKAISVAKQGVPNLKLRGRERPPEVGTNISRAKKGVPLVRENNPYVFDHERKSAAMRKAWETRRGKTQ